MKARTLVLGALALVAVAWIFALEAHADGEFVHIPGTHHLTVETTTAIYAEVVKDYLVVHPGHTAPPRAPVYDFTTSEGICTITGSPNKGGCAIAITCGEWGQCGDWPEGIDTIFDESVDYESPFGMSIVYHEFWHILQYWNEGPIGYSIQGDNVMKELMCRENEAYTREAMWLRKHGHDNEVFHIRQQILSTPCIPY